MTALHGPGRPPAMNSQHHGDMALDAREGEAFYDGTVALASGTVMARSDAWETEPLTNGLKFVIVGKGELTCKLPNRAFERITGPCICAIWSRGGHEAIQSFRPGERVPFTKVALSAPAVEQRLSADFEPLRSVFGLERTSSPHMSVAALTRPIRALCAQVATCSLGGAARTLFLSGKALEIAAHVVAAFDAAPAPAGPRLTSSDMEKVHLARQMLATRLQNPPGLTELGLAVGLNSRKLQAGFQRMYAESIYSHVQALRLEEAHRLLLEGELSVSSIAYRVGYSPAHLSVAFRKKYGFPPRTLRA